MYDNSRFARRWSNVDLRRRPTCRWPIAWCAILAGLVFSEGRAVADEMKPETLERVKHATMLVFTKASKSSKGDTALGSGTGFFINSTGLAITNNHVVDPTHKKSPEEKHKFHYQTGKLTWSVITDSGSSEQKSHDAVVLYQNEAADQAVLQVYDEEGKNLQSPNYLRLQPENRLQERMPVWALGFPGGDSNRSADNDHPEVAITNGNVLQFPHTPGGRIRMIYTDVVARPGNSGGPMVDQDGNLVGTVTLMKPPEGREDTGGANYSALVPSRLTSQMIHNTFTLGKMPPKTDVAPFLSVLTRDDGRFVIPDIERKAEEEVLYYEDGDRIDGTVTSESIDWESELGPITVPTAAIAYIITNPQGAQLYLEGGDRLQSSSKAGTISFRANRGEETKLQLEDVHAVSFRTSDRNLQTPTGKIIVLDAPVCHLNLTDVQGDLKFKSRAGVLEIPLEDVVRFSREGQDKHIVELDDHQTVTGQFEDAAIEAKLAGTQTPIGFKLGKLDGGTIEVQNRVGASVAGLDLKGVLASANSQTVKMAKALMSDDPGAARAKLEEQLNSDEFRKLPDVEKDQLRLLEAVSLIRDGKAEAATRSLRRCSRASNGNIAAYAQACAAVLKRFPDFKYEGKPLSDRATFVEAGRVLAAEDIDAVRSIIRDAATQEGASRAEYVKGISATRKYEDALKAAAIFVGEMADDELIRLWNFATDRCTNEIGRIDQELGGQGGHGRSPSGQGPGSRLAFQRETTELKEQKTEAQETLREYLFKLYDYGFRIEDPDIQAAREKRAVHP